MNCGPDISCCDVDLHPIVAHSALAQVDAVDDPCSGSWSPLDAIWEGESDSGNGSIRANWGRRAFGEKINCPGGCEEA